MTKKLDIVVMEDGPLKISGAETIQFCGEPIEHVGDAYICRCGESAKKPYCDGSHAKVGFSGACERKGSPELRVWEGKTLRTYFNSKTCMHVYKCEPLQALREKELAGDSDAAVEIMKVVDKCPSGALTYEIKEGVEEPVHPDATVDVDIVEGGEVRIQQPFEINVELHERQRDARATLCRCGLSKNKPYCDGRHKNRENFR